MKKYIIGNWKMQLTPKESAALAVTLTDTATTNEKIVVGVCPSFAAMQTVADQLRDTEIALGAQDVFWEEKGAFTGEVAAESLSELGCTYVIIGHSERRRLGESDEVVAKKLHTVFEHGMQPILCVGETKVERDAGSRDEVLERQITRALADIPEGDLESLIIAYEPRWAIGTGTDSVVVAATPEDAKNANAFIRKVLGKLYPNGEVEVPILYGGSADDENIVDFLSAEGVDGVLVGGASLKAEVFARMIVLAQELE